ncbi:MAG: nucleotide exchange factor GrpE [Candidatus Eiseniibacteriota bacterium]
MREHRAPADEVEEAAAVGRWEDQGGPVEEPPAGPATPPEPDYKDRWLRAEAELQNFRRRASRDWEEGRRLAEEGVLLEMVSILDDLERALAAADPSAAPSSWVHGVTLVAQRIRDFLARQGVSVEHPLGQPFDPTFHEALLELEAPEGAAPGTVVQVVQKGYRRGGRALRPARVVVARAAAGSAT